MLHRPILCPLAFAFALPAFCQQGTPPPKTATALVRFHVVQRDRNAPSLSRDDFLLVVDGIPQPITRFWNGQRNLPGAAAAGANWKPPVDLILLLARTTSQYDVSLMGISALVSNPRLNVRGAVYGYGSVLKRFCTPTDDPQRLMGAVAGALGGPPQRNYEMLPVPDAGSPLPGELPVVPQFWRPTVIPSPGATVLPRHAGRRVHRSMSWDEALIGTARDLAREPSDRTRMVVALLDGLPEANWDPESVAQEYRESGIALYPRPRLETWILHEKFVLRNGLRGNDEWPVAPGLNWKNMTSVARLSWLDREESIVKQYDALGAETGGRALGPDAGGYRTPAAMLEDEAQSFYVAGFELKERAKTPQVHRLEIRLKDPSRGQVVGGIRIVGSQPSSQ